MQPLRPGSRSHDRICFTFFLLLLSWTPVELLQTEPKCVEAPRVPTMTRCTRCAMDEIPNEEDGSVEDPIPTSTEYCLKWFNRLETQISEDILNMTLTHQLDLMSVARLVSSEEMRMSREPLEDCHISETPKTNPLNDLAGEKECLQSKVDGNERNCAVQLTDRLKQIIPLMSTEAGKRSLPLCDDFEDYTENDDSKEEVAKLDHDTNSETALPKLMVLRDRQISNVSFHSVTWSIDGKNTILTQRTMGYNVLADWFSISDCPNDSSFGDVDTSTTIYPHIHLIGDLTIIKGWSTTQPGIYLRQVQGNASRTSGNEDLHKMGDGCQRLVASFAGDECKVKAVVTEVPEVDTDTNENVDDREFELNKTNTDILMKVEQEINEIDGKWWVVVEEEAVEDQDETEQAGCKLSTEEFERLEKYFGVEPNTFVKSVLRQSSSSPAYSTRSNKTVLLPSPDHVVEVIEQVANSSALPVYDHRITQVSHESSDWGWERVVVVGDATVSVWAEIGATFLDYYNKTFTFNSKKGPLVLYLHFIDRKNFTIRIERPLLAWQLTLELRVLEQRPLHATFRVDEMNQFLSYFEPTHPVLNATIRDAEEPGTHTVRWHLSAENAQLASLLQQGKDLVNMMFSKSPGAQEPNGLLDLLANILTGSTKEEQRRGEELISEELISMVKLAWDKITPFSSAALEDPTTAEEEVVVVGVRALWNIFSWMGVVAETGEPGQRKGEFLVDISHYMSLFRWSLEPADC